MSDRVTRSNGWRSMTLREVYPFWVLGEVPDEDIPFGACNDMLAGNMADEIVAIAARSQPTAWELRQAFLRALDRLGLTAITPEEAAKRVALDRMERVARRIVSGEVQPLAGAYRIYEYAWAAGIHDDDADIDGRVVSYGLDFMQLADVLDVLS